MYFTFRLSCQCLRWTWFNIKPITRKKKFLLRRFGNLMIYTWECAIENTGIYSVIRIWSCMHAVIYCTYCATLCLHQIFNKLTFTNTEPVLFCKYILHQAQYYATLLLSCIFFFFLAHRLSTKLPLGLIQLFLLLLAICWCPGAC